MADGSAAQKYLHALARARRAYEAQTGRKMTDAQAAVWQQRAAATSEKRKASSDRSGPNGPRANSSSSRSATASSSSSASNKPKQKSNSNSGTPGQKIREGVRRAIKSSDRPSVRVGSPSARATSSRPSGSKKK